jgi:hypothetical protein
VVLYDLCICSETERCVSNWPLLSSFFARAPSVRTGCEYHQPQLNSCPSGAPSSVRVAVGGRSFLVGSDRSFLASVGRSSLVVGGHSILFAGGRDFVALPDPYSRDITGARSFPYLAAE